MAIYNLINIVSISRASFANELINNNLCKKLKIYHNAVFF
jgi:hypothetical protein